MKIENLMPTLKLKTPVRISLNRILIPELKKLQGSVLDIGAGGKYSDYYKYLKNVNIYTSLDIDAKTQANIISPAENLPNFNIPFANVIAIELLEHSSSPKMAINEIHRVLRDGGTCILTTRFVYPYHPNPKDYFRFSKDGLFELFKDFKTITLIPHGNRVMLLWEMINCNMFTRVILNIFNWSISLFDFQDKKFAMGYIVIAQK